EAPTPAHVAKVIVSEGVDATGAATGGLWLLSSSGASLELVHSVGYTEPGQVGFGTIELDSPIAMPVIDVIRHGRAIWIHSTEEFASRYPRLASVIAARPAYRTVCLPIRSAGRCLAALAFTFDVAGIFPDAEREFLLNVARQGSLALERSQLLEV